MSARAGSGRPRAAQGALAALSVAGVVAALVLAISVNLLGARFYARWDVTGSKLYTLSAATEETLQGLERPTDVVVFLGAADPLRSSLRQLLETYQARTTKLAVRYVDPDQDPAQFLALQQKYGIVAGKTQDGRIVTDASVVISDGQRHWYVTADDLMRFDEAEARVRPRLEQALTEGLRSLSAGDKPRLCFSTGHDEASLDDFGPSGLSELRERLTKNNYEIERLALGPGPPPSLESCRVLVLAGPQVPFRPAVAEHIAGYLKQGGSVLLLANAGLSDADQIQSLGLEAIARAGGVELHNDVVIEADATHRLAEGLGEAFFTSVKEHPVTAGLVRGGERLDLRVLVTLAQSLGQVPDGPARRLLTTSEQAFATRAIEKFATSAGLPERAEDDRAGPLTVAMASELPKPARSQAAHGPRLIVAPPSLVYSKTFRDPSLIGNRRFVESAISWLTATPPLVNIEDKQAYPVGLSLTEASMSEVQRYVLLYMPGTAAVLGLLVLYRRRSLERQSRRDAAEGA